MTACLAQLSMLDRADLLLPDEQAGRGDGRAWRIVGWGVLVAPFDWDLGGLPRDPVPVDAIPDIGENQQIIFTPWMGRSPQDVEDQITYPLTVSLLGMFPSVKTIRSYSFFGFSSVYVIFNEKVRILLVANAGTGKAQQSSLPGTLPDGVQPALGPDATALGHRFTGIRWKDAIRTAMSRADGIYNELRTVQDWYVRYYV